MGEEWKNNEWQEKAMQKPVRYWIRDEIEEIIKEENVDRHRFYEVSKFNYLNIIKSFYYSFFEYKNVKNEPQPTDLSYLWLRFQKQLKNSQDVICGSDWEKYLSNIRCLMPNFSENETYYLILSEGWVYEGYISEIISVLTETDGWLKDFYIVSKKYDWLVVHIDDGECMYAVTK